MKIQKIELPKVVDERGNLTFLQFPKQVPFCVKRVFWTYGIPGGEIRGGHAYKTQEEVIVALSGSFDVVFTYPNGSTEKMSLSRSYYGIYVPALTWRHMENFSTNALSLHISSAVYSREDYIYNFEDFVKVSQ
jgi:hypothetical protein